MLNANEFFEIVGELYYARYHRLRPGKSEAPESGRSSMDMENRDRFHTWSNGPLAFNDAIERIAVLEAKLTELKAGADMLGEIIDTQRAELAGYKESHAKYCPGAARIAQLEAALKDAVEWNWITSPEDIPDDIQKRVMDALQPTERK
jgi:hypothetical protein